MARVAIVRCESYDQPVVDRAVLEAVTLAAGPGWPGLLKEPILVKPNVLSPKPPESGVCTHPAVLKAVLGMLAGAGLTGATVGDSSGGSGSQPTVTDRALKASGLAAAARETGFDVSSFDHEEAVGVPNPRGPGHPVVTLARRAVTAGAIISVPKFKTHALTTLTGAVKNLFGAVPGAAKREYHRRNPSVDSFAEALLDILAALRPALHVVDAVVAMEGEGPGGGTLRNLGLVLAGTDAVAVDAVLAAIVGLEPADVPTTRLAAQRGLGTPDLADISIVGVPLTEARVDRFKLPRFMGLAQKAPPALTRAALSFVVTRPSFDPARCDRCSTCIRNCPVEALTMGPRTPRLDDGRCIACFCCHELCPSQAVRMRWRNPVTRLVIGGRRNG
ncbi:MAG: DUF362 domain-containing protein [Bacillota bacterium]|nr:MAG: DUF362 domain-containing protein [Bacillota bacterium]